MALVTVEVVDVVSVVPEDKDNEDDSEDEMDMETEHPGMEQLVIVMTVVESDGDDVLKDDSELEDETGL